MSLPDGWHRARIRDVAEVVGGSTPSRTRSEYWSGDIPWIAPSELTDLPGRYLEDSRETITSAGMQAAGLRLIPPGSVLLTSRATIGATAINTIPVTTNQGFQSLIPNDETDGLWLYYCISSLTRELQKRGAGSTFREISRDGVKTLPVLLPPLDEQRAIAAVLDAIDEAIERTEEVIAAAQRLRDALLHDLLSHGLPGRHTEYKQVRGLGPIPATWQTTSLGDVCEVVGGSTPSRSKPEYWGGDIPWVTPTEITELQGRELSGSRETISAQGMKSAGLRMIPAGSVLLTTRATIGATAINTIPVTTNQGFQNLIPGPQTHGTWLYYVATAMKRELEKRGAGSTFREVSRDGVRSLRVPLPPCQEQQEIATLLGSVDTAIERERENRMRLESLKASAADALLTGRVR